jgi:hypothetical protein
MSLDEVSWEYVLILQALGGAEVVGAWMSNKSSEGESL